MNLDLSEAPKIIFSCGLVSAAIITTVHIDNMATSLAEKLLTHVAEEKHHSSAKVTVVGTGQVGMAAAFAMMTQVCFYWTFFFVIYYTKELTKEYLVVYS